jgi:hypothetical protein
MACISRSKWGAIGTVPTDKTDKDEIAVHHTVSPNRTWTAAQEREHLRQLEAGHIARGFSTIGYSWLVFPSGRCYVGRGMKGLPAGQEGQNTGTWAIAMVGDFRTATPTVECRREVRRIVQLLRDDHGANHLGGHGEFPGQGTECPGGKASEFVRKWRDDFNLTRPEAS